MPWPLAALGKVAEVVSGGTPRTGVVEYWGDDIAWATPADLTSLRDAYISDTSRRLTKRGLASCGARVLPPGSVLFSSRAPIGHVAINTTPMATNQGFKSFVPKPGVVHAKYLYYWLKANKPFLQSLGNGATFKEVSKAVVVQVQLPMPPIEEQRRIADILDYADTLRAKRRETLALLDDLTQSIFLDMFGDPIANQRGYEVRPLIELIDPSRPITYGILKPGDDQVDGVPYVRVVDLKDRGIDSTGLRRTTRAISEQYRRSVLRTGDLLMSIRGHVGRLAVVPESADGANITQDSARLALAADSRMYVLEFLRADAVQYWMRQRTKGAAVQGINLGDLKALPVAMPPVEEQLRFAASALGVVEERERALRHCLLSDEVFTSLQTRAFAGLL